MLVSSVSLARGRMAGIQSAAGVSAGIMIYSALSLWGLGIVFERLVWLMMAVKMLGGLYLCYLGITLWRSTLRVHTSAPSAACDKSLPARRNAFITGLLTNLANPKAIAFFASVFALALTPNTNTPTKIATALLCFVTAFIWFGIVTLSLSSPKIRVRYQKVSKIIDRMAGSLLFLFGIKLIITAKSGANPLA